MGQSEGGRRHHVRAVLAKGLSDVSDSTRIDPARRRNGFKDTSRLVTLVRVHIHQNKSDLPVR